MFLNITVLALVISDIIRTASGWQFNFGDCPLFFKEPCSSKSIKFDLSHTKNGKTYQQRLDPFHPKLPKSFNNDTEIKIVIHGYGGLSVDSATTNVTAAYQYAKKNVITVDWDYLARLPCYVTAFWNTWHVAQCTSILIVGLMTHNIALKNIHVIGFSLGAHIAGFTGTQLKETAGLKLKRITGLDPALPFFATLDDHWKLDPEDAEFVDVIHTSALTFGKVEASGHVDFYMNGGMIQPFCKTRKYPPLCSHILAGVYYAESIFDKRKFIGIQCSSGTCFANKQAVMGENVNQLSRGIYYVDTAAESPFALGDIYTQIVHR